MLLFFCFFLKWHPERCIPVNRRICFSAAIFKSESVHVVIYKWPDLLLCTWTVWSFAVKTTALVVIVTAYMCVHVGKVCLRLTELRDECSWPHTHPLSSVFKVLCHIHGDTHSGRKGMLSYCARISEGLNKIDGEKNYIKGIYILIQICIHRNIWTNIHTNPGQICQYFHLSDLLCKWQKQTLQYCRTVYVCKSVCWGSGWPEDRNSASLVWFWQCDCNVVQTLTFGYGNVSVYYAIFLAFHQINCALL